MSAASAAAAAARGAGGGARPHSVPFIVPASADEGASFIVTKEALEMLGRIKVPVAPVAVVGERAALLSPRSPRRSRGALA